MVELPEEKYKKLVKDADDNRAIVSVLRWSVLIIFFIFAMATYGCHAIDLQKQRDNAYVSVEVRNIESDGLNFEQYIEWLDAKNGV